MSWLRPGGVLTEAGWCPGRGLVVFEMVDEHRRMSRKRADLRRAFLDASRIAYSAKRQIRSVRSQSVQSMVSAVIVNSDEESTVLLSI